MPSRGRGHHSGLAVIFVVVMVAGEWFVRKGARGVLRRYLAGIKGKRARIPEHSVYLTVVLWHFAYEKINLVYTA